MEKDPVVTQGKTAGRPVSRDAAQVKNPLIARVWEGTTISSDADRYIEYLLATGVKDCHATPGNRGVFVLRRIRDDRAEFLFISLWESLDAIRAFAGPDAEKAVYYPEDRAYLLELQPHVDHFEVFYGGVAEPSPPAPAGV